MALAQDGADDEKKAKTTRGTKKSLATAKRKFAAKNAGFDVTIKMKDEEGKIVDFDNGDSGNVGAADQLIVIPAGPAKKKKKAKTVRPPAAGATDLDA